jgi:hypothetical protein
MLEHPHPRLRRADGSFVQEVRELACFYPFDLNRLLSGENIILAHAFVARARFLTGEVLQDPKLEDEENLYLYLLLAARGARFRFNGRASVVWNRRSRSKDNSAFTVPGANPKKSVDRIFRRLAGYAFPLELPGQILPRPRSFMAPSAQLTAFKRMAVGLNAENQALRRSRILRLWRAIRGR